MSESGFKQSDLVKLRISSQLDASKQFLVILIGLAVANAVAENLKYSLAGNAYGLRMVTRDSISDQLPTKFSLAGNDPLYSLSFGMDANSLDFLFLSYFSFM